MSWAEPRLEPNFPPFLTGRRVVPGKPVSEQAVEGACAGDLGACDVLWDEDATHAHLAIVLEPEVSLARAAQMLPLAVSAAGDCIGALAPPQVGVSYRWLATVLVNGAPVGELSLVASGGSADAVPDWIVVSMSLRLRWAGTTEPGEQPEATALAEEGCEELTALDLLGSYARHFMTWLNIWQDDGFRPVHLNWTERVEGRQEPVRLTGMTEDATVAGMDEDGNLLVKTAQAPVRALSLLDVVIIDGRT